MRLHDDARKLVAFLGERITDSSGASVPRFGGTGFFVSYPAPDCLDLRFPYLVTAAHVADRLAGPFVVGANEASGKFDLCDVDRAAWYRHPDPNVDVSLTQLGLGGADWQPFPFEAFADHDDSALFSRFGIGDLVY